MMKISLTVLLMDLGRLSSRTGPWSSSASPNAKDTMRGSLKSGRACRLGRGGGVRWSVTEEVEEKEGRIGSIKELKMLQSLSSHLFGFGSDHGDTELDSLFCRVISFRLIVRKGTGI